MDAARSWARAVAVKDGAIVAVGTDDEIRPLVGPRTEVVPLAGRMLMPGFQDAHVHAMNGGMNLLQIDMSEGSGPDDYARIIRAWADEHPDEPWVLGGGWELATFPGGHPSRQALDAIVPDRPAFFVNSDLHGAWANTRALEIAGIDASTADPADGRIERDASGGPQGSLHEGAMWLVVRHIPETSRADRERALLLAQAHLHSHGITAWQEAIVGEYPTMPNCREVYPALAARGELTGRVVGALWFERGRGLDQIDELVEHRRRTSGGRYQATTVKIMLDGVCESQTAAMLSPFVGPGGGATGGTGLEHVDRELLRAAVVRLDALDFQVHIHVIGDRAARDALDAIGAAREANGWRDTRPHLAHLQVVHPDELPRFRRLGVTANIQALWAALDRHMIETTLSVLGPERAALQYPFGSIAATGASMCCGSDWPVSTPSPMRQIHVAVNRVPPADHDDAENAPEVFLPEQRITLARALHAFTMGSAYVNHLDDVTGSIEVGKQADLVVLSENPFALGPERLSEVRAVLTTVGGRTVWEAPSER